MSRAALERIIARHQLRVAFPPAVQREVEHWRREPGIDASDLLDLEALPFATIDGPFTRDLDQALHIEATDSGWLIHYAIADAAWFVRPGSALFDEALLRGASYYLPGLTLPMLPPELSEGVISLNPRVARRAVVFRIAVDRAGHASATEVVRARIRSRDQLKFEGVSALLSGQPSPLSGSELEPSLRALAEVGAVRQRRAEERGVVRFRRIEIDVQLEHGLRFVASRELPNDAERHNEQISLLANEQGALLLAGQSDAFVEPIYRVHPPPDPARLQALARLSAELAARDAETRDLAWQPERESLAEWLARLPERGPGARLALALHQQALMTSGRSSFSAAPGAHFGTGAALYARFTAPMREVVGVFLHQELLEKLAGAGSSDEALRQRVIEAANRAKELDKRLTKEANELVLDDLFENATGGFAGTVVGISPDKIYVVLDEPPIEVKVYRRHLGPNPPKVALGDLVALRVRGRESSPKRSWIVSL
jgi:ribonuclease R